jgi:hypothetical protein
MAIRHYLNDADPTSLTANLSSSATTANVASTAGYPAVPFTAAIDRGTPDEEAVLVTAVTGTTMTVTRGFDGTTAVAHNSSAAVEHVAVAADYTEANSHINDDTRDDHTQYMNLARLALYVPKWYFGTSKAGPNPINTSYSQCNTLTIPTATFSRKIVLWGEVAMGFISAGALYRARIGLSGSSIAMDYRQSGTAGEFFTLMPVTEPLVIAANASPTYTLDVRRDAGSGGSVDTADANLNRLVALVTANI